MNWIADMNKALNYIEENLEIDIDSGEVAKAAHMSKFHFLRIFKILTGITVGDYVRERRLSLSAKDVLSSELKIIDIAYKYGYETPEAFTKAFKRLHGISPSEARKNKRNLKAIPPLSFQITVKGEKKMNYKIEVKENFKIVGISRRFNSKNGDNFKGIPKFWNEVWENGQYKTLEQNQGKLGIMGVCSNFDMETQGFDYSIAVEGDKLDGIDNYKVIEVPKLSFAIFECIGPMPNAIQEVTKRIFAEWFPATKYEHADGPEFEIYLPGNPNAEDYRSEVWIPVVEK
ncbi:AraC family transcriptional regulator [Clostridium guangxiense]|uniref:AraC family transcriptional regulator n=1 Tax=Clostridium guangxiense TaxID=1662055 RepID=UPI001E30137D|nr:AraC family transcriptional regulator [Clostridium guangxiense]MCD2347755.1 AraC family transcriptional regulator [Clostridium guangxiense]